MSQQDAFLDDPAALNIPWVDSPFFERQLEASDADPQLKQLARDFHRDGYVVLNDVIPMRLVDKIVADYPRLFDPDTDFGVSEDLDELLKRDPARRQDAWAVNKSIRAVSCNERVLEILRFFYRREPIPFQTLNFMFGTEQPAHSDAIHFSCIPSGYMCGVWVALEDMTEDNGPLVYYPGSHRLPELRLDQLGVWPDLDAPADLGPNYRKYEDYVRAVVKATGLEQKRLIVKKGTALIWSYNVLHGGSPIRKEGSTRLSQVTHYYFENCAYISPIFSNLSMGEVRLKPIHDLARNRDVQHTINGTPVEAVALGNGNHRLFLPGTAMPMAHPAAQRSVVSQQVLDVVAGQLESVLQDRKANTLEKAKVVAQLAELALRCSQSGPDSNGALPGPSRGTM